MSILEALKNIVVNLTMLQWKRYQRFRQKPTRKKLMVYSSFILPVVFFYYEILFRLRTTGGVFRYALILTLLFSICWGMLGYFLCTLFPKPKHNRRIKLAIIGLTALPFIVEYFVYRKFKTLYDLRTVLGGAGDVAGGFMGDAARMIFSFSGLLTILLFLLPFLLYLFFGGHFDPARPSNAQKRIRMALRLVIIYLLTLGLLMIPPSYRNSYSKQYTFEAASKNFGFMTGVRLDVKQRLFGRKTSFVTVDPQPSPSPEAEDPAAVTPEVSPSPTPTLDTSPNVMDIDFAALAESDTGTYAEIDSYVASLTPTNKNEYTGLFKGKNLIFLSAEAFSAEVIDPERTPTLYRLATKGINIPNYYQPEIAGTTGGEYHNIFGMLTHEGGGESLEQAVDNYNPFIMGEQLNKLGYWGAAYHNNDYTYYSRDYTHNRLGYSQGFMGYGNGMEEYVDATWPESDLQMMQGTVPKYINNQPFNIYYMTVSGHSDYTFSDNMMSYQNMEAVEDLDYSMPVQAYLAANLELEKAMAYLVEQLEVAGIADDTVIVLSADHFPYGLDDDAPLGSMPYLEELYGYKVEDLMMRDHNRLIIWCGILEDMDPIVVDTPVLSVDILPTLNNLFGLEWDSRLLPGRDIFSDAQPLAYNNHYDWVTEKGKYLAASNTFVQSDPSETLPADYVSRIQDLVRNKINYADSVLATDYFGHIFGEDGGG